MTEPRVHLRHCRAIERRGGRPVCASGIRALCERHGIHWADFLGKGAAGEAFLASGDHYALLALENARKEQAGG